ncbi:MAG: hypothetical protein U0517_04105 [Candidatus Andersenbacteria bacterium]
MELLKEYRCNSCRKLLFKGVLIDSAVEIKCKNCKMVTAFTGEPASKYVCLVYPCQNRVTALASQKK